MPHEFPELPELELQPGVKLGGLAHDPATGVAGRIVGINHHPLIGWTAAIMTESGARRDCFAECAMPGLLPEPKPEPPLLSVRLPWDVLRSTMTANYATEAERILLDALPKDVHDRLAAELEQ